ncbi:MAG: acetate--CoA ligase family protein [Deltaproteobacteria bacterium]|nr:acetate--CoA ligase family protein [Deltaproteobacteria bacterium]
MTLECAMRAKSVAVVGASRTETKRGYQAIKILLDEKFEGCIYPVNPKEKSILGIKCYEKVSDIEDPVEIVLITTPAASIPAILEDCGIKGVCGAVIIAGGFSEIGQDGKKLESAMVETARKNDIRLIGPNTSGMINVANRLNLVGLRNVPQGDIALLSQSGNMALTLITEASIKSSKGFSYYVGVGNEADTHFHEYLKIFLDDPETKVILMYVEGMRDGRAFLQQAYETTRHKPVIMLKSGRSATGQRTAGSHTGALAGLSEVARTAFKRVGVVIVENSDEMFPAAETLSSLPPVRNNRIAILADGGGHATIAADLLSDANIDIPTLSDKTQDKLREILPAAAAVSNPVDVAGGADANPLVFAKCAKILLRDPQIGGLLLVGLFGGYGIRFSKSLAFEEEDAAHQMGKLVRTTKKPIVVHSLYNYAKPHALDLLRYYGITVYDSLEIASKCIGVLADHGNFQNSYEAQTNFVFDWGAKARRAGKDIIELARSECRTVLLEHEARSMLELHGAKYGVYRLVDSADEAIEAAASMEGPVAMKIVSPQILHKSEAGGVKLNLTSDEDVRRAYEEISVRAQKYDPTADIRGVLISPMAREGLELIVGTKIDDQFGPVIMFGIGGIMVEILKDVSFRVMPLTNREARLMIDDIRSVALLDGYRGRPPVGRKALRKLLLTVSEVVEAYPDIHEMDLNPVIAYQDGIEIVDARILLKAPDLCANT